MRNQINVAAGVMQDIFSTTAIASGNPYSTFQLMPHGKKGDQNALPMLALKNLSEERVELMQEGQHVVVHYNVGVKQGQPSATGEERLDVTLFTEDILPAHDDTAPQLNICHGPVTEEPEVRFNQEGTAVATLKLLIKNEWVTRDGNPGGWEDVFPVHFNDKTGTLFDDMAKVKVGDFYTVRYHIISRTIDGKTGNTIFFPMLVGDWYQPQVGDDAPFEAPQDEEEITDPFAAGDADDLPFE